MPRAYASHEPGWRGGPGIHYVVGDVTISGNAPALTGVTIMATGRIIAGSLQMSGSDIALGG